MRATSISAVWSYAQYKFMGYSASKAAVNMLTVQLAAELNDTGIKVNSADSGFTATDLNNTEAPRPYPKRRLKLSDWRCLPMTDRQEASSAPVGRNYGKARVGNE